MYKRIIILALLVLSGCGEGVDLAEYEKPTPYEQVKEEVNADSGMDIIAEQPSQTTVLGKEMVIEIDKKISVNTAHTAKGWRDGVSGTNIAQKVQLQFIRIEGYTALLVIHHLVGEYTASAEFAIVEPWREELTLDGNQYSTKVQWPNSEGKKVLVLKYNVREDLVQVILGNRTFFLRELPTTRSIAIERNAAESELYATHIVLYGENLAAIARKYGTTVEALISWNDLDGNTIHPGQNLIVHE